MQTNINSHFINYKSNLSIMIKNFNSTGSLFGDGQRNTIKLFKLDDKTVNIKSFKIPNIVNQIAYKYFRKSKAKRSYEYANKLLENGIGTPQPVAYAENLGVLGLRESYYVSEHISCELTFRELVQIPDFPDHDDILRQFVKFTFSLHEKGIEFLDHSPGNTLIKKEENGTYSFFLVDLNRMNFHDEMDFDMRMKNFSRLTPKKEMISIMSNEYAKLYSTQSESIIFEKMWFYTNDFQEKFQRKRARKKMIFFWR